MLGGCDRVVHLNEHHAKFRLHYRYDLYFSLYLHSNRLCLEHMEEDEETPKAIPPWVELEYAVR